MPASNKSELLEVTRKAFTKFGGLIDQLDPKRAMKKRDEDTSIKDVIAHRAHWIELFLGWYADGLAGKPVFCPAEGYTWSDLKRYNADLRARQSKLRWDAAKRLLLSNHNKIVKFIEDHEDSELYSGPMKGANNAWTPGRWAEAAGPSHYRSAAKYIRASLKSDAKTE